MTEYNTFDDYVKNIFNIEPSELTHISPQEQKNKTVEITVDELINIWNELTELKLKVDKSKWHYVKDGDLPEQYNHTCFSIVVLSNTMEKVCYRFDSGKWLHRNREVKVTAWHDLPKMEVE